MSTARQWRTKLWKRSVDPNKFMTRVIIRPASPWVDEGSSGPSRKSLAQLIVKWARLGLGCLKPFLAQKFSQFEPKKDRPAHKSPAHGLTYI
ncbi:unnamed protein product [Prunus armeniaca]